MFHYKLDDFLIQSLEKVTDLQIISLCNCLITWPDPADEDREQAEQIPKLTTSSCGS